MNSVQQFTKTVPNPTENTSLTKISATSFECTSNPPRSSKSISVFGDDSCGEPLLAQHLLVDFTPTQDSDSEFIQKKCCAFWKFLSKRRDLQHYMAMPDTDFYAGVSQSSGYPPTELYVNPLEDEKIKEKERTAVSMLDMLEEKGLINRAFESKMVQSHCSLGSREYREANQMKITTTSDLKRKDKTVCSCAKANLCKSCTKLQTLDIQVKDHSSAEVQHMCSKMQQWDLEHPKCRPICKSRRREWKDEELKTSAELLLERKPLPECFRRWPTKIYPNSPCPLFGKTRRLTIKERNAVHTPQVVRICQAPIEDTVDTPYLRYANMTKKIGAWDAVRARCAYCPCGRCCPCVAREYLPRDAERATQRRNDMKQFDARVRTDYLIMRVMYD